MRIEAVTPATFELILPLIADYQRFYDVAPDAARNRAHFGRLLSDPQLGIQFIAVDDAQVAHGFATLYFPLSSLSATTRCLLNDLYVVPDSRGAGIGHALIDHCAAYAHHHGFGSLFWQTSVANLTAQQLYDRLPTTRSTWFIYTLPTDPHQR